MTQSAPVRTGRQASPIVGENIRSLRQLQKMSQSELASLVGGTDQSAIARIEQGKRVVSIEEAQEIASALGATVLDLLSGVGANGDRLFYARVVRPMRELEARFIDSERVLSGISDGSIQAIVTRLSDGLAAYTSSALEPQELIESGESVGQVFTLASALLTRYEVFMADLDVAVGRLAISEALEPVRDRTNRAAQARKVARRD